MKELIIAEAKDLFRLQKCFKTRILHTSSNNFLESNNPEPPTGGGDPSSSHSNKAYDRARAQAPRCFDVDCRDSTGTFFTILQALDDICA